MLKREYNVTAVHREVQQEEEAKDGCRGIFVCLRRPVVSKLRMTALVHSSARIDTKLFLIVSRTAVCRRRSSIRHTRHHHPCHYLDEAAFCSASYSTMTCSVTCISLAIVLESVISESGNLCKRQGL